MKPMGFYLWLDTEVAWAQGTYEYRPMGAAVIASSDLFRRRDFDPRRKPSPTRTAESRLTASMANARTYVTTSATSVLRSCWGICMGAFSAVPLFCH